MLAMLPGFDDPEADLPVELFEYAAHELAWEARLLDAEWRPGAVSLGGSPSSVMRPRTGGEPP